MELQTYFRVIRRWIWLILLSVAISATSSFLTGQAASPLYQTKTSLMVGRVIDNPDPSTIEINTGQQLALTYSQLSTREPVLRGAIQELGLTMGWQTLAKQVRANVIPNTQMLEINVVDSDPYRAKVLADAIAHQLILQSPTTPNSLTEEQAAFTQQQIDDLIGKIATAQEEILHLNQELDAANSSRLIQDLQNQVVVLENKVTNWQNTYSQLLTTLNGGSVNTLRVIEEATVPLAPFSPNIPRSVLLASVLGLVISVGGAFLIEYLDDTIKSPDEAARTVDLPMLGAVNPMDGKNYSSQLISEKPLLSPVVEAYRVVKTNIQLLNLDRPMKTLMITSPSSEEGKSLTAANLAVVAAQSDLKVILVDTDFRRPVLHQIFDVQNRMGLTDLLMYPEAPVSEMLVDTGVKNLRLLPSGPLPPNPAEVLGSVRMKDLVESLKNEADLVLFDSPPSLFMADATILGSRMEGVIMVFDAKRTRMRDGRKAVENLQRLHVNLIGFILNRYEMELRNQYRYFRDLDDYEDRNGKGARMGQSKRRRSTMPDGADEF